MTNYLTPLFNASSVTQQQMEGLEALLDSLGTEQFFCALSEICDAKADHVASNWQDELLANRWGRLATKVAHIAEREAKGM